MIYPRIDVGSKEEIYTIVRELASQGGSDPFIILGNT